ncbi:hypothetical protein [Bacillus paralicheniformis]|uniref:hypothetical protein n=1 Tax=Bacillus paralicheniformis TaxID=1648923 RepID=UPI00128D6F46|nr:hypothetical protein [Bacillus paralicheniformis]MPQ24514.1 hypothetical protein [Bacillus paralicheniformis]
MKEVLGLMVNLSKIDNVKTVLIAAAEQLEDENKKIFLDYKENAIDKEFIIDEYSDEAPIQILGEQVWAVLRKITERFNFKNLRIFEKTSLFIKEIIQIFG